MEFSVYLKKLTPQELGYRKGTLRNGQYFYVSKFAVGSFFEELDRSILNDYRILRFNDPLVIGNVLNANYVFHNDRFNKQGGTRNEYRIYLNREIAKHELHFEPNDIVAMILQPNKSIVLEHYKFNDRNYNKLDQFISLTSPRGKHALTYLNKYKSLIGR